MPIVVGNKVSSI